jgi:DNA-binding MarR family transcriptional regulator
MEQRGLVSREPHPGDTRGASITLSDNGRRAVEAAAPRHVRSVRTHFIDLLTRDQLVALSEIADVVVAHLAGLHNTTVAPSDGGTRQEAG